MSKKYVIDIPDDAQYILINGASENHCYTRVEQVDDIEELNSDYINEHFGELQDEAYQRGINDGSLDVKQRVEGAYQAGMDKAWEIARRIRLNYEDGGIDGDGLRKMFGTANTYTIIKDNTASEAVAKIKAYDNVTPSDRIEVGDEVKAAFGTAVVTYCEKDKVEYIYSGGTAGFDVPWNVKKTGKHYDIKGILEAMGQ